MFFNVLPMLFPFLFFVKYTLIIHNTILPNLPHFITTLFFEILPFALF